MSNRELNRTNRVIRSITNIVSKAVDPFNTLVKDWHSLVARKTSGLFDDKIYIEYDRARNQYVLAAPHMESDPDEYQVGHTAGKLAILLGLFPILIVYFTMQALSHLLTFVPIPWVATVLALVITILFPLATLATVLQFHTLGVDFQATNKDHD